MRSHAFATRRTARVVTHGDPARAKEIWFLVHGYGQLAGAMLESCAALAREERLLVAPEALSRFYLRGGSGPIGASWMTRAERDAEIEDYVAYLDDVALWVERELACVAKRRVVLGFSQGAKTAWRWIARSSTRVERLIAWGSDIPPDVDLALQRERFAQIALTSVRGARDPLHEVAHEKHDRERLATAALSCEFIEFAGAHTLDPDTLARIAADPRAP